MTHEYLIYAWEPYVEDHLRLGWMFARRGLIYEDRGGHPTFLMLWPCDCTPCFPKTIERENATR